MFEIRKHSKSMISSLNELIMKIRCIYNHGDTIPSDVLSLGNTVHTVFHVEFDREYTTYGICIWRGVIHYLVLNDKSDTPNWLPAFLFRVQNARLPNGWSYYSKINQDFPVDVIIGYAEITQPDGRHYIDLIEREHDALLVFQQRRIEIDGQE